MKKCCFFILSMLIGIVLFGQEASKNNPNDVQNEIVADDVQNDIVAASSNEDNNSVNQIEKASQEFSNSFSSKERISLDPNLKVPENIEFNKKNHFLAVYSNLIIPGLGHVYLKDYKQAGSVFGTSLLGYSALFNKHTAPAGIFAVQLTLFYEFYASYRDLRSYNKNIGYSYQMPTDSFIDLCLAPFNYKVLKKPEVWGGLLADFALVVGISYLQHKLDKNIFQKISSSDGYPLIAFPVGIAEESMFRGYMQSSLSETFTPIGGIALSSFAFGAAHILNTYEMEKSERKRYYTLAIPYITLSGVYYGWVAYRNHSLKECVALHSWYDFTILAIDKLVNKSLIPTAIKGKPTIAIAFDF